MSLKYQDQGWIPFDNVPTDIDNSAELTIGNKSNSVGVGLGYTLEAKKPQNVLICGDDGNAALSAIAYRNLWSRLLLKSNQSGDVSIFGIQGQVKNLGTDTSTANKAGVWAYYEAASGATAAVNSCGLMASIDVPSGATIGGTVSAVLVGGDLGGTHTGKAACLAINTPSAGVWDFAIIFDGVSTGATAVNTANLGSNTLTHVLKVRVGDTAGYIPILAAAPT